MLGDSMGATAALAFSPLATAVHAFTPQVVRRQFSEHVVSCSGVVVVQLIYYFIPTPLPSSLKKLI
jgi:hypothetical protein